LFSDSDHCDTQVIVKRSSEVITQPLPPPPPPEPPPVKESESLYLDFASADVSPLTGELHFNEMILNDSIIDNEIPTNEASFEEVGVNLIKPDKKRSSKARKGRKWPWKK
jgi:hypothetical protein